MTVTKAGPDELSECECELIEGVIQDVCDLPGDNDPDADDTLILSVDDLRVILERNAAKHREDAERPLLERIEALEVENARLREALQWWQDRRFALHAKFDLHGPQDMADAMKDRIALDYAILSKH